MSCVNFKYLPVLCQSMDIIININNKIFVKRTKQRLEALNKKQNKMNKREGTMVEKPEKTKILKYKNNRY